MIGAGLICIAITRNSELARWAGSYIKPAIFVKKKAATIVATFFAAEAASTYFFRNYGRAITTSISTSIPGPPARPAI